MSESTFKASLVEIKELMRYRTLRRDESALIWADKEIQCLQAELAEAKRKTLREIESAVKQVDEIANLRTQLSQVTKERDEQKITLDIINGWCHGNIDTGAEVTPFCIQVRDLIERPTDQEGG